MPLTCEAARTGFKPNTGIPGIELSDRLGAKPEAPDCGHGLPLSAASGRSGNCAFSEPLGETGIAVPAGLFCQMARFGGADQFAGGHHREQQGTQPSGRGRDRDRRAQERTKQSCQHNAGQHPSTSR
jgi:hypothetical protein